MLISASTLVVAAFFSPAGPGEITPVSLATRPPMVDLMVGPYDWTLQQRSGASVQKLTDNTANCNTCCIQTSNNGKTDEVHDCGFD